MDMVLVEADDVYNMQTIFKILLLSYICDVSIASKCVHHAEGFLLVRLFAVDCDNLNG